MAPWWWSWLLAGVGLMGLWLAGSKRRIGWAVGLGAQALWISYALVSEQFGFIAASCGYGFVYARNWWRWRREHNRQHPKPSESAEVAYIRGLAADVRQRQGLRKLFEEERGTVRTIEIKGVWLTKKHDHLGGDIEVLVELPDGTHRAAISGYACDDGPISHYVHPAGIASAPVREFDTR